VRRTKAEAELLAKHRRKQDQDRIRAKTFLSQDIGRIPPIKNRNRRQKATASFRYFCEAYFPAIFFYKWSKDLLRVIRKIESVVVDGETLAVAMPRGSGKTRLCQAAALWAVLTWRHPYVKLIGAVVADAKKAITWFKDQLSGNPLLLEDFPEVCYPIHRIDNEGRKCPGQRHKGQRTNISWGIDAIVLPTIKGSRASGAIIECNSLEGHIRGAWKSMPDGSVARPTLAICDDPQTRESARSQGPGGQTTFRLQVINEDVQGLAGPDRQTAILVPCTVILPGDLADQLLDRKSYPNYRGERTRRFYSWPENKALWEEYRELRDRALRADEPLDESFAFYRKRQAKCGRAMDDPPKSCPDCKWRANCMDCGAQVDWADRLDDKRNLSAVQATMHAFYKYGPAGFAAEFQNDPLSSEAADKILTAAACAAKVNARAANEVPIECTEITAGLDVQQSSLWYVVIAWQPNFTGYILDYGVWPKQNRRVFTLRDVAEGPSNLAAKYPKRGIDGAIYAGLEELVPLLLNREYVKVGGAGLMRIGRLTIDLGGRWAAAVAAVKRKVGGAATTLCKGVGIRAGTKPMSSYKNNRKPGERHGEHWYMPQTRGTREFPYVAIDTNYWKSFIHAAFLTPAGDPGAMTIYGQPADHALFASHITAETFEPTHGYGRDVQEWTLRPQKPDNHWLDASVYAAVAASMQGIAAPNAAATGTGVVRRRRVSIDEMLARRNQIGGKT